MAGERTFVVKILGNADGAITAFKKLGREGQRSLGQLQTVGNAIGGAFDVLKKTAFIAGAAIGAVGAAAFVAVQKASDLNETISKTNVIFGDAARTVQGFADNAARALGQTRQQALDAATTFGTFGKSAGLVGTELANFSTKFVTLATDLASFNNTSPEEAVLALGAALRGEAEPIRRFGVLMNDAALKQVALEMGIYDGNGALTAQQKVLASSELLFRQTTDAQGDFERTSGGLANQQRILRASIDDIVTTLGELLLPLFTKFVTFINDNIVPAVKAFADNIGEHGVVMAIGFAIDSMGDMGVSFVDTLEQMTIGVLQFLKQFVDIGRTIALTVSLVGALTGNVALTLKATAASLAFKAAQQGINGALERTPALFDKLREAAAKAAVVQANALPKIIGTADALERAAKATGVKTEAEEETIITGGGVAKTVETAKQKLEKYTSALKSSTNAQKSFTSAQKASIQAQKSLDEANTDLATAQENFNRAVAGYGADSDEAKAAQRELSKSQRSVAQAGFRVEESVFAVRDAEQQLAELRADPKSSAQAIRQAEINLAQAKLSVADASDAEFEATRTLKKAQLELNEAVSGAIEGSTTYNTFLEKLNEAKDRQQEASDRLTDALDREIEAYENLAEAIAKVAEAAATMPKRNLTIPSLPTVPTPTVAGGGTSATGGAGTNININT
ncbi:MAG: hypothetical protein ACO3IT_08820, partial [Ilumatobacteraceae bacterium]